MPFDERSSLTVTRPTLTMRFSRYQKVTVTLKVSSAVSAVVPSVSLSASVSVCSAESPPAAAPDFSTAPTDEFLSKAGIPQQRAATVERFAKELEPIIDGIEYAHRRSPLRLTANTMTRNNLAVFGEEKGAKINALLFRPIQLNEAERMRFVNGQFDEFTRTFGKVTEAESAIAQKLIEAGTDAEEAGKFPTVDKLIESKTDEKRRADEKIEALEAEAAAKEQSREARDARRTRRIRRSIPAPKRRSTNPA